PWRSFFSWPSCLIALRSGIDIWSEKRGILEVLQVSKELQLATRMSAQEIRRELAVHLYTLGKLSIGKARELAEMTIAEFQCLLGSRSIPVNYGSEDFAVDLDTIRWLYLDQ